MSYTYEVHKDKTVTIYREGSVCVVQTDDPATPEYDAFESKARAEEWAKEAIKQYAADEEREKNLKHALGKHEEEKEILETALKSLGENAVGILDSEASPSEEEATKK